MAPAEILQSPIESGIESSSGLLPSIVSSLARSRVPGCDSLLFFVVVRSRRHARRNKGQWISPTVVAGNERFHQLQLP
jgi:hypothetical protein